MSTVELPTRLPRWLLVRRGKSLPVERMRLRLAAYVYGGILVLGAIAVANGETTPTIVLLLPTVTSLPTEAAQLVAGGWIALQFSFLGVDVARLSGRRPTLRTLWSGIALALAAGVVVVLKVTLAH